MAILPLLRFLVHPSLLGFFDESDQFVITDALAHFGLSSRLDEATPSLLPASPGVFVTVVHVGLDVESDWDSADITPSGVLDVRHNFREDFSFIQEMWDNFSICSPCNDGEVF